MRYQCVRWGEIIGYSIAMIIVLILAYGIPVYNGYHLEWSWINGRWIWVK